MNAWTRHGHGGLAGRLRPMATLALTGILALGLTLAAGCVRKGKEGEQPVVTVKSQDDVKTVLEQQKSLEITPESIKDNPGFKVLDAAAVQDIPTYRLGPGDVLEVVYHIKHEVTPKDYRLDVQDRISVAASGASRFGSAGSGAARRGPRTESGRSPTASAAAMRGLPGRARAVCTAP